MSDEQRITDDGDLRKYRTEIPNIADDELDPFDYRLYGHYKRVGDCWESVRTTAEKTKMSVGQVVASRRSLEANGWIVCEDDKAHGTIRVSIKDRWAENFRKYAGAPTKSSRPPRSSSEHDRSPHEQQRSPGEPKKEPLKKEPLKNNGSAGEAERPKADKPQNLVYNALADVFFGIKDIKLINGDGGRIAKVEAGLRRMEPSITVERIQAFGAWYDEATRDGRTGNSISRPKDLAKVQEWWARFCESGKVAVDDDPYLRRKRV